MKTDWYGLVGLLQKEYAAMMKRRRKLSPMIFFLLQLFFALDSSFLRAPLRLIGCLQEENALCNTDNKLYKYIKMHMQIHKNAKCKYKYMKMQVHSNKNAMPTRLNPGITHTYLIFVIFFTRT